MQRLIAAAFLALAPAAVIATPSAIAAEVSQAPEVNLDELKKIVEAKSATIIDVNAVDTYNKGHIPGAVNFAKNEKNFASVLPKDKNAPLVAYCGGPLCTAWQDAAKAAQALGYTNIKHFKGGIKVWKESGQKVEKAS